MTRVPEIHQQSNNFHAWAKSGITHEVSEEENPKSHRHDFVDVMWRDPSNSTWKEHGWEKATLRTDYMQDDNKNDHHQPPNTNDDDAEDDEDESYKDDRNSNFKDNKNNIFSQHSDLKELTKPYIYTDAK